MFFGPEHRCTMETVGWLDRRSATKQKMDAVALGKDYRGTDDLKKQTGANSTDDIRGSRQLVLVAI